MTATQAQGLPSPHSARLLIFAESGDTFTVVADFYSRRRRATKSIGETIQPNDSAERFS